MASYVEGISQAVSASTNTSSTSSSSSASSNAIMGKEDFLTLLVAQLQNQDPLNPSDPTEFTAQLAQFGQLEQLINLNSSIEDLTTAQTSVQQLSALSLIGKTILAEGSTLQIENEGDSAKIGYVLDNTASELSIQVQDSSGKTVRTLQATSLDAGTHSLLWDGKNDAGEAVKAGKYSLVLQAQSASEDSTVSVKSLVRGTVTGVDLADSGIKLETAVGSFSLSSIHGVYDAEEKSTNEEATATTESGASGTGTTTATGSSATGSEESGSGTTGTSSTNTSVAAG